MTADLLHTECAFKEAICNLRRVSDENLMEM